MTRTSAAAPERVDAVVVGSGFGGSVSACRLAEAGLGVLVLERGRRYPPGSFARSPWEMARNVWDPSAGLHGLFDVWTFRRLDAVVASGLGGGSLIYANVLLRKDEKWFVRDQGRGGGYESWPVSRKDLDPCYQEVETVLGAVRYPYAETTPKTQLLQRAAPRLGMSFEPAPLAITFGRPGEPPGSPVPGSADNLHRRARSTCRLCGECNIGCNTGSKNTLDFTYLSRAHQAGADIRERCEVRTVEPRPGGGYRVAYVEHVEDNEGAPLDTSRLPVRLVDCRVLVLAAGSLGTSFLLLRNRTALPGLSPALGSRFSGNGDVLAWIRRAGDRLEPSNGPVITSCLRHADALDGGTGRGFYVQDGGHPGFVDWVFETTPPPLARYAAAGLQWGLSRVRSPRSSTGSDVARLLAGGSRSGGVLPLLALGRDVPDGALSLRSGWLAADLGERSSGRFFAEVRRAMAGLAEAADGRLLTNPGSALQRRVTVHPLGGAPMAAHRSRGVTDDHGEVFGHPGLFVADGAVMPGPVGANPALTIAALAERFSTRMKERAGVGC